MAGNLAPIIPATFVGRGGARMTPEEIKRSREIAAALGQRASDTSPVQHWTQGLARLADGFGAYRTGVLAKEAEGANSAASAKILQSLLGSVGATPAAAPAVAASAVPTSASAAMTTPASTGGLPPSAGGLREGIIETATALGIDPVDLATTISYETAGTFDPTKAGPTTQWGQHRGLIQFGEPQAQKYGVNWDDPVGSQLGANGAVANYLRDTGVQPGMGLLDIYSAVNAGGVGRYNRSDANNGGAPGTVRDKVEQQMAGHRAKALALLGDAGQGGAPAALEAMAAPVQVASADASFMPEAAPAGPSPDVMNALMGGVATAQQADPSMAITQALTGSGSDPWQGMREVTAPMAPAAPQQVAQAAPQAGGINPAIIEALSSPYVDDQTKQIAGMLLGQQLQAQQQANDPMRAIEMERAQLELEALRNPRQKPIEVGGVLLDPTTMQPIYDSRQPQRPPASVQEYEYARGQGYQGSFAEFEQAQRRAGATNVTTNVGEGNKFYETLDADNAKTFSALSEAGVMGQSKLAQIDRLDQLLTSSPTGGLASLKLAAGEYGLPVEGLDDLQAAQALINELVPQQRQPGSGPMSDADLALFKQSLPRIINQPGGNKTIIQTMRGITEYQIQMGQIADAVADRAMTPAQAREAIRSLPNPLAQIRQSTGGSASQGQQNPQAAPAPGNYIWNPATGQMEPE